MTRMWRASPPVSAVGDSVDGDVDRHAPDGLESPAGSLAVGHHLVLVGLPGAGKSTVGRIVAELAGCPFLDTDVEIERRTGLPISDIFLTHGEARFRELEHGLTAELRQVRGMVVAPGGGWILDSGNVALLRPPARIIHLRVTVDVALSRLGNDAGSRPLLMKGDPAGEMARLERQRSPLYASADAVVDTQTLVPQEVAQIVRELASRWDWPVG
jgi:shikimate kinase